MATPAIVDSTGRNKIMKVGDCGTSAQITTLSAHLARDANQSSNDFSFERRGLIAMNRACIERQRIANPCNPTQ
jgi:hypothetical protein